jgi:hypothetical protein
MPEETFEEYHCRLLKMTAYIGHHFFLAYTTWNYRGQNRFELTETVSMKTFPLVIVGHVEEMKSVLNWLSIIKTSLQQRKEPPEISLKICLKEPRVSDEFKTDFCNAWSNLRALFHNLPIPQRKSNLSSSLDHVTVTFESDVITFVISVFQRKVRIHDRAPK